MSNLFGKNGKDIQTMKVAKLSEYNDWKDGKSVFLRREQCFASIDMIPERYSFAKECYEKEDGSGWYEDGSERTTIAWEDLPEELKTEYYLEHCISESLPITYKGYLTHTHTDELFTCLTDGSAVALFNALDDGLDDTCEHSVEIFDVGGEKEHAHIINMSKIMKLIDPFTKYSIEEMLEVYKSILRAVQDIKASRENENGK